MTTNARDEKWSEWIYWSGGATPVSGDDIVQWKGRNEFYEESSPVQAGMLCWRHTDSPMDIIAYRYKIKEPESVSMSEDLRWLAKNCDDMMGAKYISREDDGYNLTSNPYNHNGSFSYDQWVTARKALEHEAPEVTPEEDEAWQAKEREQSKSDGMKYDSDKPAMDLIPPYMEEEVGMVLAFGAHKYAPDNWRKVTPLRSRYLAAAQRHINALKKGEQMDPESGLHHAAHAVCCLMFLGEVELEPLK